MSREQTARKLLRHGALSLADFVSVTGWPRQECRQVLRSLTRNRLAFFDGVTSRGRYFVAWEYD